MAVSRILMLLFLAIGSLCWHPAAAYAGSTGSSDYGVAELTPLELDEYTPLKVHNKGPDKARGVVYFIDGLDKDDRMRDDFRATYPIVYEMNRRFGWDVIEAKFPNRADYEMSSIPQSSKYVMARLTQLRAEGYKHIVLAGQSWGAWVSVDVAAKPGVEKPMDSLLLIAPANYGMAEYNGQPNEYFILNKSEYIQNIRAISVPTVAVFFRNDEFDPGGRGPITQDTYSRNGVPLLLIDGPAEFDGHGAAWQPRFAAYYGSCIDRFIHKHAASTCGAADKPTHLVTSLVTSEADLLAPGSGAKPVALDQLVGTTLIATTPNGFVSVREIYPHEERIATMDDVYRSPISKKGNLTCFDKICRKLYRLADGGFVSVDQQGQVSAWLIPVD